MSVNFTANNFKITVFYNATIGIHAGALTIFTLETPDFIVCSMKLVYSCAFLLSSLAPFCLFERFPSLLCSKRLPVSFTRQNANLGWVSRLNGILVQLSRPNRESWTGKLDKKVETRDSSVTGSHIRRVSPLWRVSRPLKTSLPSLMWTGLLATRCNFDLL